MEKLTPEEAERFKKEWEELGKIIGTVTADITRIEPVFNEPAHYHKHEIDTIAFLQKGFPPNVFSGFATGSAVKYLQRYEEKGGREDLVKALDFCKRLLDWYDKTHE